MVTTLNRDMFTSAQLGRNSFCEICAQLLQSLRLSGELIEKQIVELVH